MDFDNTETKHVEDIRNPSQKHEQRLTFFSNNSTIFFSLLLFWGQLFRFMEPDH
jgi:hypothetical protein